MSHAIAVPQRHDDEEAGFEPWVLHSGKNGSRFTKRKRVTETKRGDLGPVII